MTSRVAPDLSNAVAWLAMAEHGRCAPTAREGLDPRAVERASRDGTVGGAFAAGFFLGGFGDPRRRHDGSARRLGGGPVVVVEQQRLEPGAHVPFHVIGQHAQEHMRRIGAEEHLVHIHLGSRGGDIGVKRSASPASCGNGTP